MGLSLFATCTQGKYGKLGLKIKLPEMKQTNYKIFSDLLGFRCPPPLPRQKNVPFHMWKHVNTWKML